MIKAHVFCDGKMWTKRRVYHAPRVGDTIRFDGQENVTKKTVDMYAVVTEVIWCYNEKNLSYDRVNIRCEFEKAEDRKTHE